MNPNSQKSLAYSILKEDNNSMKIKDQSHNAGVTRGSSVFNKFKSRLMSSAAAVANNEQSKAPLAREIMT